MTVGAPAWAAFAAFVVVMLLVDLLVLHRKAHEVTMREAAIWTAVWVSLGLAFGAVVLVWQGSQAAGEYLSGYLIEKTLSVDTVFVFAMLFSYFAVPPAYQHRVLFWGVLGALAFRAVFILAGVALIEAFHWTIYAFGAFLVLTGIRMARHSAQEIHPDRNPVLRFVRRVLPMTSSYEGQRFFVRRGGRRLATPLVAVLVAVETTDILFAVDSIPAIFSVTQEPYLVFTSNAFAMLGLRAMYFLLAGLMERLSYLRTALSAILVLGGVKMLLSDIYHVPIWVAFVVIAGIVATALQRERMSLRDLRSMVTHHRSVGADHGALLAGAFDAVDRRVRDVMVARPSVVALAADLPAIEAAARLASVGHSRAPVFDGDIDNVTGVVHLIDLVRSAGGGPAGVLARSAPVVAENLKLLPALRRLQEDRREVAIVVDEHGGFEGIVTLKDLVEEVVGDIADEFPVGPPLEQDAGGVLLVSGSFPVHDLLDHGVRLPPGPYSTVAGFILAELGHVPAAGEAVHHGGTLLEVVAVDRHAITQVRVVPAEAAPPQRG